MRTSQPESALRRKAGNGLGRGVTDSCGSPTRRQRSLGSKLRPDAMCHARFEERLRAVRERVKGAIELDQFFSHNFFVLEPDGVLTHC